MADRLALYSAFDQVLHAATSAERAAAAARLRQRLRPHPGYEPPPAETLAAVITATDPAEHARALAALQGQRGTPVAVLFEQVVAHGAPLDAVRAAEALVAIYGARRLATLGGYLDHADPPTHSAAAEALRRIWAWARASLPSDTGERGAAANPAEARELLVAVAVALAPLDGPRRLAELVQPERTPDPDLRLEAVRAVGRLEAAGRLDL